MTIMKFPALDGIRGLLATWVFLGHLAGYCALQVPGLSSPGSAVDIFMLLSGFLMVVSTRDGLCVRLSASLVQRFYLARLFRVMPLYYVLLLACVGLAGYIDVWERAWLVASHGSIEAAAHLLPDKSGVASWQGVALHMSFVFGLLPQWATSTPMPDWSLSLEMQFYAVFPLLIMAWRQRWWDLTLLSLLAVVMAYMAPMWLGKYQQPGSFAHFVQPSVLLLKLNVFVAGMCLAWAVMKASPGLQRLWLLLLVMLLVLPTRPLVWVLVAGFVWVVFHPYSLVSRILSWAPLRTLGDWSYGVYLAHFIVMAPVLFVLQKWLPIADWSAAVRFLVATVCCAPVVWLTAAICHRWIELPGIAWGKRLSSPSAERLRPRS